MALPTITVDEPAISVVIGTNTSPLVGRVKGHKLTARHGQVASGLRADRQRVAARARHRTPRRVEVQGRGELALAILVEQMRREGFELTVGKPAGRHKHVDGKLHEPFEELTIDTRGAPGRDHPSCWPTARARWSR